MKEYIKPLFYIQENLFDEILVVSKVDEEQDIFDYDVEL